MPNLNKWLGMGNLTRDPTQRFTPNGTETSSLSLAINKTWTDSNGEKKEKTAYVNIVAWNKLAKICNEYLYKGSSTYVEGEINTRSYEKEGQKVYVTEVVASNVQFLSKPKAKPEEPEGLADMPLSKPDEQVPF